MDGASQQGMSGSAWNLGWTIPKDIKGGQSSSSGSELSVGSLIINWLQMLILSDRASRREFQPKLRIFLLRPMESLEKVLWGH